MKLNKVMNNLNIDMLLYIFIKRILLCYLHVTSIKLPTAQGVGVKLQLPRSETTSKI